MMKKVSASSKPKEKPTAIALGTHLVLWKAFDGVFERFRGDFEDLLFPSYWYKALRECFAVSWLDSVYFLLSVNGFLSLNISLSYVYFRVFPKISNYNS